MFKKNRQYVFAILVFCLLAISAALLAGAVYLAQGESPEAAPALAPEGMVTATATISGEQKSALVESAGRAVSTTAMMSAGVSDSAQQTPTPSGPLTAPPTLTMQTPLPTSSAATSPMASATQKVSAAAQATASSMIKKTMTIQQLISHMKDAPLDRYSSIGIVKRSDTAYYAWAQDLYLVKDGKTKRILSNADSSWMYVDESFNLWFGVQGGIGIKGNKVLELECVYRYNRDTGSFTLMRQETEQIRFPDGQGILMMGPYYLYLDGAALMACHTVTGKEIRIDAVTTEPDVRVSEEYCTVYYRDARGEYMALSNLGEANQAAVRLDMTRFPGGRFCCDSFVMDAAGKLYQFRRTGYVLIANAGSLPSGLAASSAFVSSSGGIGFPGSDTVILNFYDVSVKSWFKAGSAAQEGSFCQVTDDGHYWFVNWKPASLFQIEKDKVAKYDLSTAMSSCVWAGAAGGVVFLSENDFYSDFTHAFLQDQKVLYEITFPLLPGDKSDR